MQRVASAAGCLQRFPPIQVELAPHPESCLLGGSSGSGGKAAQGAALEEVTQNLTATRAAAFAKTASDPNGLSLS